MAPAPTAPAHPTPPCPALALARVLVLPAPRRCPCSKRGATAEAARYALRRLRALTAERDSCVRGQTATEHSRVSAPALEGGGSRSVQPRRPASSARPFGQSRRAATRAPMGTLLTPTHPPPLSALQAAAEGGELLRGPGGLRNDNIILATCLHLSRSFVQASAPPRRLAALAQAPGWVGSRLGRLAAAWLGEPACAGCRRTRARRPPEQAAAVAAVGSFGTDCWAAVGQHTHTHTHTHTHAWCAVLFLPTNHLLPPTPPHPNLHTRRRSAGLGIAHRCSFFPTTVACACVPTWPAPSASRQRSCRATLLHCCR
jgi:hypothetical protein